MKSAKQLICIVFPVLIMIFISSGCAKEDDNNGNPTGTMTDIEGNIYQTVTIGTQTWMAENLRVTKYRNGDPLTNVTSESGWGTIDYGAWCSYNNDANNVATYGRLYNWYAVAEVRNLAPAGWHIPTHEEWTTLVSYLGGENVAGGKMKEEGTIHWVSPNTGATNESGFTALPAGVRVVGGAFYELTSSAFFWSVSTSNVNPEDIHIRRVDTFGTFCDGNSFGSKNHGYSVRCIKD